MTESSPVPCTRLRHRLYDTSTRGLLQHVKFTTNPSPTSVWAFRAAMKALMKRVGLEGRSGTNPMGLGGTNSDAPNFDHSNNHPATDPDPVPLIDPCAAIIDGATPSSPSKAPFARGHRRRSTHVTRRDLEKFQKEVLGVEHHASWFDEENGSSRPISPHDPQLEDLNRAFALADMSMNSGAGLSGSSPGSGMFSGYVDGSPGTPNMGNIPRQSMSPALSHSSNQVNGSGMAAMNGGMSMNAGHQMDLHHLYEMVLELSDVLKNNREVTKNIVTSAEEIMVGGFFCTGKSGR